MGPEPSVRVELASLLGDFPEEPPLGEEWLEPAEVPSTAHELLVHHHHMTVTLEAHHGEPVSLVALERRHVGQVYSRKLLLKGATTGKVVLFGIARIHLDQVSARVQELILEEKTPLGRLLIEQGVLRRVERTALLRFLARDVDRERFGLGSDYPAQTWLYGRLALLHCDGKPAIELLEVVRPEPGTPRGVRK